LHQYWFFIGSFPVRAYSTLFALAFLLGISVTLYIVRRERKELVDHFLNLAPLLLISGIIGARIWQVFFFDWPFYKYHLGEIIAVWHGGLSIQGGIVGSLLASYWYIRRHKLSFWVIADLAAPGLVLGQSIGRDANLLNGDAFGGPTGHSWGLLYPPDTNAAQTFPGQALWPAEVWEGQFDVILFALLLLLKQRRWPTGYIFLFYNIAYNFARFWLEHLRGDSMRFLFNWTAAEWTSVIMIVISVILMIILPILYRKKGDPGKIDVSPSA